MGGGKFSSTGFSPTGFSLAQASDGRYARMLAALLPPGKLWRLIPGASTLYALLEGCADELDRLDERVGDLLGETDPRTAVELLPEYERQFALATVSSIDERRARIVARTVQRQRYRPLDFETTLAPLLGTVTVIERSHAFAVSIGDDREIFRFFVYRNPSDPGDYFVTSAQEQLDRMKPSHTAGYVIESVAFRCGDQFSLCGRDLLGA